MNIISFSYQLRVFTRTGRMVLSAVGAFKCLQYVIEFAPELNVLVNYKHYCCSVN